MEKRPRVAVLNTIEAAGANIISDANEWGVIKTSALKELLLGMFRTGKLVRTDSFDPQAEVSQIVNIGADAVPEVITASTRYKVEIGNPEQKYESHEQPPAVHAYTSPANLTGTASLDRANVYTALATKINNYAGNNAKAYTLTVVDYTLGGSVGDAATNFIVGEVVTQQTSGETARVAKSLITSGTFAADNAAGKLWLFDISDKASWLETAVTLSGAGTVAGVSTNCVVTQTNATTVHDQGLAIEDDAGYFISSIDRAGANWVGVTQGFTVSVPELGLRAVYSMGIGSEMAQLVPRYDHSKQDAITGFLEYELQNGDTFDVSKTYRKYVFTVSDGDESSISAEKENSDASNIILYADYASANLADLNTAIGNLT
jgi:hypothetical protein